MSEKNVGRVDAKSAAYALLGCIESFPDLSVTQIICEAVRVRDSRLVDANRDPVGVYGTCDYELLQGLRYLNTERKNQARENKV